MTTRRAFCSTRCADRTRGRGRAGARPVVGWVDLGRRGTPLERFMVKVVDRTDGCWEWIGSRNNRGYGLFMDETGVTRRAHRWSYEHFVGPIDVGLTVDHVCEHQWCVNPKHLEVVTASENLRRYHDRRTA